MNVASVRHAPLGFENFFPRTLRGGFQALSRLLLQKMQPWSQSSAVPDPTPGLCPDVYTVAPAGSVSGSDMELARAVMARDRKAAAEFVERFSGPLYAYVRSRLAPATDVVEDIMQDVFVIAWQGLPNWSGTAPLQAWLMGIARHKVEDHYRKRLREAEPWVGPEEDVPDFTLPMLDLVIDKGREAERAMAIVDQLPENYRLILRWRYWDHMGVKQIAEQTGQTGKAVERLLARAREQFRRRWLHG